MKKLTSDPPLPLSVNDKREVCALHGWVGRKRFQAERHDLCDPPQQHVDEDIEDSASDALSPLEAVEDALDEGEDGQASIEGDDGDDEVEADAGDAEDEDVPVSQSRTRRASTRRQGVPPKKTLAVRRITQLELAHGRDELKALGAEGPYWRPKMRGECAGVPRPCPYVACKYSLYLDISETGSIILNFPHLEPGEMLPDQSCALDLAEKRAMTLEEIAGVTNLTRERIRQVELKALLRRARPAAVAMGLGPDDAAALGARHRVGPGADLEETGVDGAVPSDVAALLSGGGNDES